MDLNAFERHHIQLNLPLLILKGSKGLLACGYLNVETFNKTGEVAAIVTGVKTFEDMTNAAVAKVSQGGEQLGLRVGMTGAQALELIR
jgi:uncharacterized protein YunC (DUF1805 family)